LTTLTLAGNGTLTNLLGTTDPASMTNILTVSSNANWTLMDNSSSTPITIPVQLDILAGTFNFGQGANAPNLSSTASANNSRLGVTVGAPATFNMVKGTLTIAARLNTGSAANSVAILNQSGGTLNIQQLLQSSDGSSFAATTINVTGGTLNVGDAGGPNNFFLASRGTGVVTVASSGVINCATLDVSRNAAGNTSGSVGVVNLNGGILAVSRVGAATGGAQAGGTLTATFNFNGGTLKANASSTTFYQGNASSPVLPITSIVKTGGAIIDTTNFNISILEPLRHDGSLGATADGGLTKYGTGILTLTATNTYTGPTVVNNGTLAVNGSLGTNAVTVAANATLSGTGTAGTNVTVNAGGTLSPAGPGTIGTLTVAGNVTLQSGSTNFMELNKSLATSDQVRATAATATTITYGGTLSLTNLAGNLAASDTFKLFSATNYSGAFSAITPATPAPGLGWNTNTLVTDGILRFVTIVNSITFSVSGNTLNLSWPADHLGWTLQTNSVSLLATNQWFSYPGSSATTNVSITLDQTTTNVFFRLLSP
jgi:autotransporter-associated beta strand protein